MFVSVVFLCKDTRQINYLVWVVDRGKSIKNVFRLERSVELVESIQNIHDLWLVVEVDLSENLGNIFVLTVLVDLVERVLNLEALVRIHLFKSFCNVAALIMVIELFERVEEFSWCLFMLVDLLENSSTITDVVAMID